MSIIELITNCLKSKYNDNKRWITIEIGKIRDYGSMNNGEQYIEFTNSINNECINEYDDLMKHDYECDDESIYLIFLNKKILKYKQEDKYDIIYRYLDKHSIDEGIQINMNDRIIELHIGINEYTFIKL